MRWFLIAALIAVLIIDLGFAWRASDYEVSGTTKYQGEKDNQHRTLEGPFVLAVNQFVALVLDIADKYDRAITALSTLVIAVFTVILAWATAGLWKMADRQAEDMKESLRIADESAKAAKRTVETMGDTAKKELRAYMGIGGGEVYRLPDGVLRGTVVIKNFGETPAHNVQPAITGDFRKPEDTRPFPDPDFIPHKQPIAPTMHWEIGHEFRDKTLEEVNDVYARKLLVYVWGHVKYDDIYGEPHTIRFRFRNVVASLMTVDGRTGIEPSLPI